MQNKATYIPLYFLLNINHMDWYDKSFKIYVSWFNQFAELIVTIITRYDCSSLIATLLVILAVTGVVT